MYRIRARLFATVQCAKTRSARRTTVSTATSTRSVSSLEMTFSTAGSHRSLKSLSISILPLHVQAYLLKNPANFVPLFLDDGAQQHSAAGRDLPPHSMRRAPVPKFFGESTRRPRSGNRPLKSHFFHFFSRAAQLPRSAGLNFGFSTCKMLILKDLWCC